MVRGIFLLFVFSVFKRCRSHKVGKDPSEMVFGMKTHKSADGGNRIACVFEIVDRNIDLDGVEKTDRRLSKLPLKEMVERRFAHAAVLRELCHRKILVPMIGEILDCRLKRLVKGNFGGCHFGKDLLQKSVKEGIGFQLISRFVR